MTLTARSRFSTALATPARFVLTSDDGLCTDRALVLIILLIARSRRSVRAVTTVLIY
jgi:hypothetical protein